MELNKETGLIEFSGAKFENSWVKAHDMISQHAMLPMKAFIKDSIREKSP